MAHAYIVLASLWIMDRPCPLIAPLARAPIDQPEHVWMLFFPKCLSFHAARMKHLILHLLGQSSLFLALASCCFIVWWLRGFLWLALCSACHCGGGVQTPNLGLIMNKPRTYLEVHGGPAERRDG